MSFPFSKLPFSESSRMTSAVVGVSLAAVGTAIYLSPAGTHTNSAPESAAKKSPTAQQLGIGSQTPTPAATPSSSARPKPTVTPHRKPPTVVRVRVPFPNTKTDVVVVKVPGTRTSTTTTTTAAATQKHLYCSDFTYQQDAQAAYVANLSDPWGLDGAPGAHNGDGLACTQLPVDPNRAASIPADAYVPPAPASKAVLAAPSKRYFGISEDGLPGDTPLYDSVAQQVKKAPSALQWFSYWDTDYEADKVQASWAKGALPVITWMSVPSDSTAPGADQYTLANIVSGKFDDYLLRYAGSILKTNLPVAIRLDHEMNGNWYPWSAGLAANQATSGQPNLYVQAWRHVWNVFQSVGANQDVIWTWAPVRVDNISPHSTVSGYKYETTLAEDYPGDAYVDWVGMSAYQYKPSEGWTYEATFRKTLDQLSALTAKPVFVSETGATEEVGTTDYAAEKAQWTTQTLAGLAKEPNVVGFAWFNNSVDEVHKVDGSLIRTDWQFSSSPAALAAFTAGIADPQYSSGVMPDSAGGS